MSTPPTYPFRSRREIHSGQPKVYSDAPNEDVTPYPGARNRLARSCLARCGRRTLVPPRDARRLSGRPHAHPYPGRACRDARAFIAEGVRAAGRAPRVEADRRCLRDDRHALSAHRQRTPRRPQA